MRRCVVAIFLRISHPSFCEPPDFLTSPLRVSNPGVSILYVPATVVFEHDPISFPGAAKGVPRLSRSRALFFDVFTIFWFSLLRSISFDGRGYFPAPLGEYSPTRLFLHAPAFCIVPFREPRLQVCFSVSWRSLYALCSRVFTPGDFCPCCPFCCQPVTPLGPP